MRTRKKISDLFGGKQTHREWRESTLAILNAPRDRVYSTASTEGRSYVGTWGAGNLDDDSALDWLGGEVDKLVETIQRELSAQDESNDTIITAAVEVLALICEQTPAIPPKPAKIAEWRRAHLEKWNSYIDQLDPQPGFKEERQRVISSTFDRLAAVAQKKAGGR
jgi:Domain of unknown function (DUF4259)